MIKNRYRLKFSELDDQETLLGAALLTRLGKAKKHKKKPE
jgi:hypothetical protein